MCVCVCVCMYFFKYSLQHAPLHSNTTCSNFLVNNYVLFFLKYVTVAGEFCRYYC
jgi:hypothetical protein